MITRTHLVLIGVLLALVGAELALAPDRARREDSGVLFPRLETAAAQRVEVEQGEVTLVLERGADGWLLDRPEGFAAESRAVTEWLGGLTRVLEADRVGRLDTGAEAFGFETNGGALVRVFGVRGELLAAYREGTRPVAARAGTGRLGVHLNPLGSQDVYRASGVAPVEARAERFWNPRLFEVPADDVRLVELALGDRRAVLERGEDGGWLLREEGGRREAPGLLVAELLTSARALYLTDVTATGPDDDAEEIFAELRVELEEGRRQTLRIGPPSAEGIHGARRSDWGGRYRAELPASAVADAFGERGAAGRLLDALGVLR